MGCGKLDSEGKEDGADKRPSKHTGSKKQSHSTSGLVDVNGGVLVYDRTTLFRPRQLTGEGNLGSGWEWKTTRRREGSDRCRALVSCK